MLRIALRRVGATAGATGWRSRRSDLFCSRFVDEPLAWGARGRAFKARRTDLRDPGKPGEKTHVRPRTASRVSWNPYRKPQLSPRYLVVGFPAGQRQSGENRNPIGHQM